MVDICFKLRLTVVYILHGRKIEPQNQLFSCDVVNFFRLDGARLAAELLIKFFMQYTLNIHRIFRSHSVVFMIFRMQLNRLFPILLFREHSEARTRAAVGQKGKRVSRFLLTKYLLLRFCVWLCYFHLLINLVGTAILLVAAHKNYPGGHALMRINEHFGSNPTKGKLSYTLMCLNLSSLQCLKPG